VWQGEWRRGLFDWEADEWMTLIDELPIPSRGIQRSEMHWDLESSGKYTVYSGYKRWEEMRFDQMPLLHSCWTGLVPYRVEFFLWLTIRGRIATREFLANRNMLTECLNICPMCLRRSEDVSHLFLRCKITRGVWDFFMRWIRVKWCQPRKLADLWRSWGNILPSYGRRCDDKWTTLFYAIVWVMWNQRNAKVFRQTEYSELHSVNMIFSLWQWWLKSKSQAFAYSVTDMMHSPVWLLGHRVEVS